MKIAAGAPSALPAVVLTSFLAVIFVASSLSAAPGDWPQWRGNAQQTGYQPLPSNITRPVVGWQYRVGGRLAGGQLKFSTEDGSDFIYLSPAGSLSKYTVGGQPVWTRHYVQQSGIIGVFDLEGDGRRELLVAETPQSGSRIDVFDAATGAAIWTSPFPPGSLGTVKIADLNGDGARELVWLPAAGSDVYAWTVRRSGTTLLWHRTIADFISAPYSPSELVVGDVTGDGRPDVVIMGALRRIVLLVLAGADGELLKRADLKRPWPGLQSGGGEQALLLRDLDGDGIAEIVVLGGYPERSSYMLQGIIVASYAELPGVRILDSHPFGVTWVGGSVDDFDGDGRMEIIGSRYDAERAKTTLVLFDARTLVPKIAVDGYLLMGVADTGNAGKRILVADAGTGERSVTSPALHALRVEHGALVRTAWSRAEVLMTGYAPAADTDNPGGCPTMLDVDGDGMREIMVRDGASIVATNVDSGAVVRTFPAAFAKKVASLDVTRHGDTVSIFTITESGELIANDGQSSSVVLRFGGTHLVNVSDGHMREPAITADLDGDGINEIYVTTTANEIVRLRANRGGVQATTLFRASGTPRMLASTDPADRSLFVGGLDPGVFLRKLTPAGDLLWSLPRKPEMDFMVGLNSGRFGHTSGRGIVTAGGPRFPMPTYACDAATGAPAFENREDGPLWDGTFAIWDFDGDGYDEIVFNQSYWKGYVLSGLDGRALSEPAVSPEYERYGLIDYNGVPSIFDADGDGHPEILVSEDDTHMMLL
ncbi:MAG: hypothetical protein JWO56_471, partial [Acidobacteria bacterium]|nr:hypothetical protein [Acidobacteriota bacterium]